MKPVTSEETQKIKRLLDEGLTIHLIAQRLDRSPGTIGRIKRELGLTKKTKRSQKKN